MSRYFKLASLLGFFLAMGASSALANSPVETGGSVFQFQKCSLSETSVPLKCDFLVENIGERRTIQIYSDSSHVYDTGFNDIAGTSVSLGGREYQLRYNTEIPEETTLKGSMTFGKAPEGELTSLDIHFITDNRWYKIKLPLVSQ